MPLSLLTSVSIASVLVRVPRGTTVILTTIKLGLLVVVSMVLTARVRFCARIMSDTNVS